MFDKVCEDQLKEKTQGPKKILAFDLGTKKRIYRPMLEISIRKKGRTYKYDSSGYNLCLAETRKIILAQWFPTGGSRPQSGSRRSCCVVANSSLSILLKARIVRNAQINLVCCIGKIVTKVYIFVKFTLLYFLSGLHYTVSIDLNVEIRQR